MVWSSHPFMPSKEPSSPVFIAVLCAGLFLLLAAVTWRHFRAATPETAMGEMVREESIPPRGWKSGDAASPGGGRMSGETVKAEGASDHVSVDPASEGSAMELRTGAVTGSSPSSTSPHYPVRPERQQEIAHRAETPLERQNRLWWEGVETGKRSKSDGSVRSEKAVIEAHPTDWAAQIVFEAGFEWGSM